ncbi:unnamed protein product, partial [Ectocarpus sp. 6 AP-2014]
AKNESVWQQADRTILNPCVCVLSSRSIFLYHFACFRASGHLSLAEVSLFSRFLLRGTQGDRRYITVHARGPPATLGTCARRPKLKRPAHTPGTCWAPQKP